MDVRLTLGEVGRWGRAVLITGGSGREVSAKSWFGSSLRTERVDELGALRRNRGSRLDSPHRPRRRR